MGNPFFCLHLARMAIERNRWIVLIKQIRLEYGLSLAEAEAKALEGPNWRRWVEVQVNTDPRCRKMALRHIRERGDASLLRNQGDIMRVR